MKKNAEFRFPTRMEYNIFLSDLKIILDNIGYTF